MAPGIRSSKRIRMFGDQIENVNNIKEALSNTLNNLTVSELPNKNSIKKINLTQPVNNIDKNLLKTEIFSQQQLNESVDEIPKGLYIFIFFFFTH